MEAVVEGEPEGQEHAPALRQALGRHVFSRTRLTAT
jgi:hypothetical protein